MDEDINDNTKIDIHQKPKSWVVWVSSSVIIIFLIAILIFLLLKNYNQSSQNSKLLERAVDGNFPRSVTENTYPDVDIFYEEGGQIWKTNLSANSKVKIVDGMAPALSPDKKKLAYVTDFGVRILNLKTGEDILFLKGTMIDGIIWSWNGDYLIVDSGTSPERYNEVFDFSSGKEMAHFSSVGGVGPFWIAETTIVFNETQYDFSKNYPRPWGEGGGTGISTIDIWGNKKNIKKATETKEFHLLKFADGKIFYELTEIPSNSNWDADQSNQMTTYFVMDRNGENEQVIGYQDESDKVKNFFGISKESTVFHISRLNADNNWILFMTYRSDGFSSDIYIGNLNNKSSLKKIGPGIEPVW